MEPVITYLDYKDRPTQLTEEELTWFYSQVERAKRATGCTVDIIPYDHELYYGSHKEAIGCCCTNDPCHPLLESANSYITIDCFYIDECWKHEFNGNYLFDCPLIETIAHEIAHLYVWNHGKKHAAMTEKFVKMIEAA